MSVRTYALARQFASRGMACSSASVAKGRRASAPEPNADLLYPASNLEVPRSMRSIWTCLSADMRVCESGEPLLCSRRVTALAGCLLSCRQHESPACLWVLLSCRV